MSGIGAKVRLTREERELQPTLRHAIGTVVDIAGRAVKVRWGRADAWHKSADLEPVNQNGPP